MCSTELSINRAASSAVISVFRQVEEGGERMRNLGLISAVVVAAVLSFAPAAFSQRPPATAPKPGMEVPLVTPGPGWKACPRCLNDGYAIAARKKANVDTRKFDAHD